ncbi:hypothetical protein [Streptomyces avidinii]
MPLIVVVLAMTAGCVTVRPAEPGPPGSGAGPGPVSAGPRTAGPGHWTTVEAKPLGRLPQTGPGSGGPVPDPAGAPAAGAPAPAPAAVPGPGSRPAAGERRRAKPVAPRQRPERKRRAKPARTAAAPARGPAAKPRRPGAGPNSTYDMAPLCAAARGTVDPSIVALCH